MSSAEYKNFIERVKICLRQKRKKQIEAKCSMNEIFETFSADEKKLFNYYKLPVFIKSFSE